MAAYYLNQSLEIEWSEEFDDENGYEGINQRPTTCRYCKTRNLYWRKTDQGWRLHDSRGIHHCKVFDRERQRDQRNWIETSSGFPNLFPIHRKATAARRTDAQERLRVSKGWAADDPDIPEFE
jgi:hypothetical protein